MQVVLNKDVKKLGYKGDIVSVKRGFFRNYLLPNGLADFASKTRLKVAETRKEKIVIKKQQLLDNAKEVVEKLKGLKVVVKGKVTEDGKLYGSITEDDVIKVVEEESKLQLEKSQIKMDHFKELGEHKAVVHLGEGLEEEITVQVETE